MVCQNIYSRFVKDNLGLIKEFQKSIKLDEKILSNILKEDVSDQEIEIVKSRMSYSKKRLNVLFGERFSFYIVCVLNNKKNPCKDALEYGFSSNFAYVDYLMNLLEEVGYKYYNNIIEDIRNMYLASSVEYKDFNYKYGMDIDISCLGGKKRIKKHG